MQSDELPPSPPMPSGELPPSPPMQSEELPPSPPMQSDELPPSPPMQSYELPPSPPMQSDELPPSPPMPSGELPPSPPMQSEELPPSPPMQSDEVLPSSQMVSDELLPPSPPECCGNGCYPCVLDIYNKKLEEAEEKKEFLDNDLRSDILLKIYFKPFTLVQKDQLSCDVFKFRFKAGSNSTDYNNGYLPYRVGQHLSLKCPSKKNEEFKIKETISFIANPGERETAVSDAQNSEQKKDPVIIRAYTPITIAEREKDCCFEIFVKIYKNGVASDYLKKSVVGDKMYWRGPQGSFEYFPNKFRHVLMVCMGTGLAPMIPVTQAILDNELDETIVHLMYGVKNIEQVILRERLIKMTHYWNFSMVYYFSEKLDLNENTKFGENVRNGKINQSCLNEYIKDRDCDSILVLVCGTDSFTSDVKNYLCELGVNISTNVWIF